MLATLPGISQVSRYDSDRWGDHWRFTSATARRLFGDVFDEVEVVAYGNVLSAAAFLYGYAQEDLTADEIAHRDEDFEVTIGVRAVRSR